MSATCAFVELKSDAAVVRHSRAHVARSSGAYFLARFQLDNESVCSQGGEDVHLRAGDFSLCDTARPYQLAFDRSVSILTLRVAKNVLQRYVGSPENLVHIPVSGSTGAGALASRVIREIWKSSEIALAPGVGPRCANVVLELIASAYVASPAARRTDPVLPRLCGCASWISSTSLCVIRICRRRWWRRR